LVATNRLITHEKFAKAVGRIEDLKNSRCPDFAKRIRLRPSPAAARRAMLSAVIANLRMLRVQERLRSAGFRRSLGRNDGRSPRCGVRSRRRFEHVAEMLEPQRWAPGQTDHEIQFASDRFDVLISP